MKLFELSGEGTTCRLRSSLPMPAPEVELMNRNTSGREELVSGSIS